MKQYVVIIFLSLSLKIQAQTELNSILKNVVTANLPYTSISPNIDLESTKIILHETDSMFLVSKLNKKMPKTINRYGDSPFGQIDCEESTNNIELTEINNCLKISDMKEIAILCYLKINENKYLLHLKLTAKGEFGESKGILVSVSENGDVIDWFFSNGSANSGNPNGNVSRDFTIQKNFTIDIQESSWGKENIPYSFKAKYEIVLSSNNNDDFKNGEFRLKTLSLKY